MDSTFTPPGPAFPPERPTAPNQGSFTELGQRARLLEATLSAISDFTYSFDRQGRFLYVNKPLLDLWGLRLEQAVGKNFHDLKYPEDLAARLQIQINEVLSSRRTVRDETQYISPSGLIGYYEYIFSPIFGADGAIEAVAGTTRDITHRVMLEKDLRDSEMRMAAALAGGHTGTWTWRPERDVVVASDVAAGFFFLNAQEAKGASAQRYFHVIHPDDRERAQRVASEAAQSRSEYLDEYRLLGPDGSIRWVSSRATPLVNSADGEVVFSGVVIDITKSKGKEADDSFLSQLSALLSTAASTEEITAITIESLGKYLGVQRCYFFEGVRDDRVLVTQNWNRPEVASMAGEYALLNFGTPQCWEGIRSGPIAVQDTATDERVNAANYAGIGIRAFLTVPYLRDGAWVAGLAVTQEVSRVWHPREIWLLENVIARVWPLVERIRLVRALQRNQNTLELQRTVLEMIVNDAPLLEILEQLTMDVEKLLGRRTKAAILLADPDGRTLRLVAGGRLSAAWMASIREVTVGAGIASCGDAAYHRQRVVVTDTARDPRWESFREAALRDNVRACWSTPILSAAGEVLGTFAIYHPEPAQPTDRDLAPVDLLCRSASIAIERDRSRQALLGSQQKLAEHAAALETHVADRTAKLQETISELETFSYSISHDLRAPLRAMQSFAQILHDECRENIGEVGRDYVRRIVTAADRMDRLIQDVLVYSRVSRTDLTLETVDLAELLAGILEGYPQFQPPKARVSVIPPLPPVLGNVAGLTQCLSNLVSNAVKFVPAGTVPEVTIWAQRQGDRVRLFVRDNGIGIEPRAHAKIFGIFYRLSRDYEGTGIGLAVARRSAERMGGSISLESAVGQGSTFCLELAAAD